MFLAASLIVIIIIKYRKQVIAESVTSHLSSNDKKRILFVDDEPDLTYEVFFNGELSIVDMKMAERKQ